MASQKSQRSVDFSGKCPQTGKVAPSEVREIPNELAVFQNNPCNRGCAAPMVPKTGQMAVEGPVASADPPTRASVELQSKVFDFFFIQTWNYIIPKNTHLVISDPTNPCEFADPQVTTENIKVSFDSVPFNLPGFDPADLKKDIILPSGYTLTVGPTTAYEFMGCGGRLKLSDTVTSPNFIDKVRSKKEPLGRVRAPNRDREFYATNTEIEERVTKGDDLVFTLVASSTDQFARTGYCMQTPASGRKPLLDQSYQPRGADDVMRARVYTDFEDMRIEVAVQQKLNDHRRNATASLFEHLVEIFRPTDQLMTSRSLGAPMSFPEGLSSMIVTTGPIITLEGMVTKYGPLSSFATTMLMQRMLEALRFLNNKQICHLQVLPPNIWIDDKDLLYMDKSNSAFPTFAGAGWQLGNFEGAKIIPPESPPMTSNDVEARVDGYVRSCEQEKIVSGFDYDRYCLGASLYYATTGQKPFFHQSPDGKIHGCKKKEAFFNEEVVPNFPFFSSFFTYILRLMFRRQKFEVSNKFYVDMEQKWAVKGRPKFYFREQEKNEQLFDIRHLTAFPEPTLEVSLEFESKPGIKALLARVTLPKGTVTLQRVSNPHDSVFKLSNHTDPETKELVDKVANKLTQKQSCTYKAVMDTARQLRGLAGLDPRPEWMREGTFTHEQELLPSLSDWNRSADLRTASDIQRLIHGGPAKRAQLLPSSDPFAESCVADATTSHTQ